MKKVLASILVLVYFVVSSGFVVSVHYCMDKVNSLELGDASHETCGKCGMPIQNNKGCCKDEVKVVKMQVDQVTSKVVAADFSLPAILPVTPSFHFSHSLNLRQPPAPLSNGPPLSRQDTYLQNCVFRI